MEEQHAFCKTNPPLHLLCYNGDCEVDRMDYTVIIREAPDGQYIASCPVVPEARAQGQTYEECLDAVREVLELCLEYRKERGEEIPRETDTKTVTVAI